MPWDLATAKVHVNIASTDVTSDIALQGNLDIVLDEVQTLLGRGLFERRITEKFYRVSTRDIRLARYPIKTVHSPNCRIVHHRAGWIEVDHGIIGSLDNTLTVEYTGGFNPLPSALEAALWGAFVTRWGTIDHITGAPTGGGPTLITGSGDVSRVSFGNFGSVGFDVGTTSSGGNTQTAQAELTRVWGWLAPWATVLETYRTESAPSVAFA